MQSATQQKLVETLIDEGCLVDRNVIKELQHSDVKTIQQLSVKPMVVDTEFLSQLRQQSHNHDTAEQKQQPVRVRETDHSVATSVEIQEYRSKEEKKSADDFAQYFQDRYERMKHILRQRQDLKEAVSLTHMPDNQKEDVAIIAMVSEKTKTRSGKYMLQMEDPTGMTKALVDEENGEKIALDEVIGIVGQTGNDIVFANEILWPDIPFQGEKATTTDDVYAAFFADTHFGSIYQLTKKVRKCVEWLQSNDPIAQRIGYLFVSGDVVDGVGKYPGQEQTLSLTDIYQQYSAFEEFINAVPENIQIIVAPGDHDAVRMGEPQPPIPKEFVPDTHNLTNVHYTSNPAQVKIHVHDNPVRVLQYHGYSYHRHIDPIPSLRKKAQEKHTEAMKDLLVRRHLAPTYGTIQMYPEQQDHLLIEQIPDIFAMGHLHAADYGVYKGISMVCSSTFQGETPFIERMGNVIDPGKLVLLNLRTRTPATKLL